MPSIPFRLPRFLVAGLFLTRVALAQTAHAWSGAPSPLDGHHLLLLWADGFHLEGGKRVPVQKEAACIGGTGWAVEPGATAVQDVRVRHAGDYALWVRVAPGERPPSWPLKIQILGEKEQSLLVGRINDGEGSAERGGPAGLALFVRHCIEQTPGGPAIARIKGYGVEGTVGPTSAGASADEMDDLVAELKQDIAREEGHSELGWFRDANRLDSFDRANPFYWWKVGRISLTSGVYRVAVRGEGAAEAKRPRLDLLVLTTAGDNRLEYPVACDFTRQPGSYVRFRIASLPASGRLTIQGSMKTHYDPFSAGPWLFNPEGFPTGSEGLRPHVRTGYTRWYRLQDSGGEKAPGYGDMEVRFDIQLSDAGAEGSTQFAGYPHEDYIVREFQWQEPDGRFLSMRMNFDKRPEHLRTIRDHSRENYDRALRATRDRLFPLTPTDFQTFGNAAGGGFGAAQDYEFKVLRLLGFNVPSVSDGLLYRRLYGGDLAGGHYWPPVFMPYDEEEARARYQAHYQQSRHLFTPHTRIFQLADEPGEIDQNFSAPIWRYRQEGKEAWWQDESGGSEWLSRLTNLSNYAVEGEIQAASLTIAIGVNPNTPEAPHGFWTVGQISRLTPANLRFGIGPTPHPGMATLAVCQLGENRRTTFRVVHEGSRAQLFVQEQPTATLEQVPPSGAIRVAMGGRGRIYRLAIRPLRHSERMASPEGRESGQGLDPARKGGGGSGELLDDMMDDLTQGPGETRKPLDLKAQMEKDWVAWGGNPRAQEGFRRWLRDRGITADLFGLRDWSEVRMMKISSLAETPEQKRLYYWSRRYSGWLTPRMFALAAEAAHDASPNRQMESFVALSGHALYMGRTAMPLDMFELARWGESSHMLAGVSDGMTLGSWRWDSHQSVAYSVAPYNAGGRVIGRPRRNFPMMFCHWPSEFKVYTMLGNQCKAISLFWYGPQWAITEWYWADNEGSYHAASTLANRTALEADIIGPGVMRPSFVAMLYAHATEYWSGASSYADKRALFVALANAYYQPELVTEEQVVQEGALDHYRALYLVEPHVPRATTRAIMEWVRRGGLIVVFADAWRADEYDEPLDGLAALAGAERQVATSPFSNSRILPVAGEADFHPHRVEGRTVSEVRWPGSRVRAVYEDQTPAWLEGDVGKGRVIYFGHRGGLTYSRRAIVLGGRHTVWTEAPRTVIATPLMEAGVERELELSHPAVVAYPLTASNGTAIILFNYHCYALHDLEFRLKESQPPRSVTRYINGFDREPLPFEWTNGVVRFVLPTLTEAESQMIVVRTREPEGDRRLEAMKVHAQGLIGEEDWRARSAGVWIAGFFPDWGLTEVLTERLRDSHYAVRRAAAEALGRLGASSAIGQLRTQMSVESDSHALAEMLMTLGRIGSAEEAMTCAEFIRHPDVMVRRGALLGLRQAVGRDPLKSDARVRQKAETVAREAIEDPDARIFGPALQLLADVNPDRCLTVVLNPEAEGVENSRCDEWLALMIPRADLFEAWCRAGMPERERLAGRWAASHVHPALVETLLAHPESITDPGMFLRWTNPADVARLFERRDRLPKGVQPYVMIALTRAFRVHLGADAEDWTDYLKNRVVP